MRKEPVYERFHGVIGRRVRWYLGSYIVWIQGEFLSDRLSLTGPMLLVNFSTETISGVPRSFGRRDGLSRAKEGDFGVEGFKGLETC